MFDDDAVVDLTALHLIESPKLNDYTTTLVGSGEFRIEKVSYSSGSVVRRGVS